MTEVIEILLLGLPFPVAKLRQGRVGACGYAEFKMEADRIKEEIEAKGFTLRIAFIEDEVCWVAERKE